MKSSYEIKKEMEKSFGKDFIKQMEHIEEKINDKTESLRNNFIHIRDDLNIDPDETCNSYLYQLAKKCVEYNLSEKECKDLQKEYELLVIDSLQDDLNLIQDVIDKYKAGETKWMIIN